MQNQAFLRYYAIVIIRQTNIQRNKIFQFVYIFLYLCA